MKKPIDNKEGLGLVAMFCQTILDEQIVFVQRCQSQLLPRTKQEDADMAWDEGLMS